MNPRALWHQEMTGGCLPDRMLENRFERSVPVKALWEDKSEHLPANATSHLVVVITGQDAFMEVGFLSRNLALYICRLCILMV